MSWQAHAMSPPPETPPPPSTPAGAGDPCGASPGGWAALLARVAAELAPPLSAAAQRLAALGASPQLDPAALQALAHALDGARTATLTVQQLARVCDPALPLRPQALDLATALREAVARHQPEARRRGTPVLETVRPARVVCDAALLGQLLDVALGWALALTHSALHLGLDHRNWPERARLHLRFRHRPVDEVADPQAPTHAAALDTLQWHLLRQTALAAGLLVERRDTVCGTRLSVEFPRTVLASAASVDALDIDPGFGSTLGLRPLAGHHVLLVTARRDLRQELRDVLHPLGLMIDVVGSVEGAREFCHAGPPHVLLHDAQLAGERLARLHAELRALPQAPVLVEIADDGPRLQTAAQDPQGVTRVGRGTLADTLPAALTYELTQADARFSGRTPA
jgi:CheY-like chemotaxis protein